MRNFNSILLNSFFNDILIKLNLIIGGGVNLLLWLGLIWQYRFFTEMIPLHYNIYFGVDLLGPRLRIFLLPLAGLIVISLNAVIGYVFYRKEKLLSYFLIFFGTGLQFVLALAAFLIIYVNM